MASIVWNEENAAHLYRRAAFGATPAEISQALSDGLEGSVDRLLDYGTVSNAALDARLSRLAFDLTRVNGIINWWIVRMAYTARPLEERMTFFLHDHFATAVSKVGNPAAMLTQNELLRRYATGNFVNLTIDISKDVAMLIWLDNATSVKDHPNENYGRELLELFTLGQGNYSEPDVQSAAKAFTGWTFDRRTQIFAFKDSVHDHSQKDFLGRVGDWNGDDIIRIATSEFAHGRLIAGKLFATFAWENPPQDVVDRFAQIYLDGGNQLAPLIRAILTSPEMYSPQALWTKVRSPIDHTIMALRQLRIEDDRAIRAAAASMNLEGLTLFNPPDVAGWDGGTAWINSGSLLSRMNFGSSISSFFDPAGFGAGAAVSTAGELVDLYLRRLGPLQVSATTRDQLMAYVSPGGALPTGTALTTKAKGLAHMIISLPDWQMC
jgi:uncharacterized protein (DUF1800 family)